MGFESPRHHGFGPMSQLPPTPPDPEPSPESDRGVDQEPEQTASTKPPGSGSRRTGTKAVAPRAFAQGTGILFQIVGVVLFLVTGCACCMSGMWDPVVSRGEVYHRIEQGHVQQHAIREMISQPARAGVMIMVLGSNVAGVALTAFGLGLQSDQHRAVGGRSSRQRYICLPSRSRGSGSGSARGLSSCGSCMGCC